MKIWAFLAKHITLQPASQWFHGTLAVLVRYNQAQKCLQYDLKHSQNIATKLLKIIFSGIFYWLTDCLMPPSDKHNSITAKATGLIFSLFNIASARQVPFDILQCIHMLHELTCVLLCVPFIFADSARCQFTVVPHDGFPMFTGIIRVFRCNWIDCRDVHQW